MERVKLRVFSLRAGSVYLNRDTRGCGRARVRGTNRDLLNALVGDVSACGNGLE